MHSIRTLIALAALLLTASAVRAQNNEEPKDGDGKDAAAELKSVKERFSYAIGVNIGRQLSQQGLDVDPAVLARAIGDVLKNGDLVLTAEERQQAFNDFRAEAEKKRKELAEKNKVAGEKFLTENRKKKGVQVTKSGLQYLVLREGTGDTPKKTDSVLAHYQGTLIDNTRFDGSYKGKEPKETDEPVSFRVGRVISGWTEALQLMKVGSRWRLFIPSELAYRDRQQGLVIGPNSVLIFDIELVGIE